MGVHLPTGAKERKRIPLYSGLVKYFPDALVEVAKVSFAGNEQHNPGQPLHWAREKSTDQEDTLMRHLFESGSIDVDGQRHSAKLAWRALAVLQLEIEHDRVEALKQEAQQHERVSSVRATDEFLRHAIYLQTTATSTV